MQLASGGRTRLGSVPTVRMSPLLARIVLNQSGESFICCDVSEWNVCSEGKQKKNTKREMWAGLETGRERFKSSLLTFSPLSLFPMQMSDCHSPSEPDGWAECAAHMHTLTWGGGGVGGGGGSEGIMAQIASAPPFRPSVRETPRKEWIIYNHFSSGSSDWCDSWPPNSLNLVICHSRGKKVETQRSARAPPSPPSSPTLPRVTTRTIWRTNLGRRAATKWLPIQQASWLCQNSPSPRCEWFCGDLYRTSWFTVCVQGPEMMHRCGFYPPWILLVCRGASGSS